MSRFPRLVKYCLDCRNRLFPSFSVDDGGAQDIRGVPGPGPGPGTTLNGGRGPPRPPRAAPWPRPAAPWPPLCARYGTMVRYAHTGTRRPTEVTRATSSGVAPARRFRPYGVAREERPGPRDGEPGRP